MEQIRLAEEVKITKEKIKEVEEEWQSNLLNWKSKRRSSNNLNSGSNSQSGSTDLLDQDEDPTTRKVKTFTEILSEKAKSGHRLGYNLRRYVATDDEDEEEIRMIEARNPHRSESSHPFVLNDFFFCRPLIHLSVFAIISSSFRSSRRNDCW